MLLRAAVDYAKFRSPFTPSDVANRRRGPNRRFKFQKGTQLFIRTHNEALTIVAMRVNNEDCSPVRING